MPKTTKSSSSSGSSGSGKTSSSSSGVGAGKYSGSGRVSDGEFEQRKIEIKEQTNFLVLRQLAAKRDQEGVKADTEVKKIEIYEAQYREAEIAVQISEVGVQIKEKELETKKVDLEIAGIRYDVKQIEKGGEEDLRYLAEERREIVFDKGIQMLRRISLDVDELTHENDGRAEALEQSGVKVTRRAFLDRSAAKSKIFFKAT